MRSTISPKRLRLYGILFLINTATFLHLFLQNENPRPIPSREAHQFGHIATLNERCRLKEAWKQGNFRVMSHRSFVGKNLIPTDVPPPQPHTCRQALRLLNAQNIRYLELDVIHDSTILLAGPLDSPSSHPLVVAHPLEYVQNSTTYSPCSNTPLEEVFDMLNSIMPNEWFVSLDLKADWDAALQGTDPSFPLSEANRLLEDVLQIAQNYQIQPHQCALILNAHKLRHPRQRDLLRQLGQHCGLALAIPPNFAERAIAQSSHIAYDYVMPNIEYQPKNRQPLPHSSSRSIYWMVDRWTDLERATSISEGIAFAVLSNRPLEIVDILQGEDAWCT